MRNIVSGKIVAAVDECGDCIEANLRMPLNIFHIERRIHVKLRYSSLQLNRNFHKFRIDCPNETTDLIIASGEKCLMLTNDGESYNLTVYVSRRSHAPNRTAGRTLFIDMPESNPNQSVSRILTIEDDQTTAEEIAAQLSAHGYVVDVVADGNLGLEKALHGQYDAITLDRMLPGLDGLSIVTQMRLAGIETPVLMISALSDVDERVRGLRAGGDDYLTKPFANEEMSARLEVLLRRRKTPELITALQVVDLTLNLINRSVQRGGQELELKTTEFKLLEYMMRNSGQILTRSMIFEAVWNYHFDPYTNLIEVHMMGLRKKINLPGLPPLIRTIRGRGYVLGEP